MAQVLWRMLRCLPLPAAVDAALARQQQQQQQQSILQDQHLPSTSQTSHLSGSVRDRNEQQQQPGPAAPANSASRPSKFQIEAAAKMKQAAVKFCAGVPNFTYGTAIKSLDALKAPECGIGDEFLQWCEAKARAKKAIEAEDFVPVFEREFPVKLGDELKQRVANELFPNIVKIFAECTRKINSILSLKQFFAAESKWMFGMKVLRGSELGHEINRFVPIATQRGGSDPTAVTSPVDCNDIDGCRLRSLPTAFESPWKKSVNAHRVYVVTGASGIGKTIFSHQLAFFHKDNMVLSLSLKEIFAIAITDPDTKEPLKWNEADWDEKQWTLSEVHDKKLQRNRTARALLLQAIKCLFISEIGRRFVPDPEPDYDVVVVMDEMGAAPLLLSSLCACAVDLAKEVAVFLFGNGAREFADRVHFIACGSGANYQLLQPGTHPSTFESKQLARDHGAQLFVKLVKDYFNEPHQQVMKGFLLRLADDSLAAAGAVPAIADVPLTPYERLAKNLMCNARAQALLLREAYAACPQEAPTKLSKGNRTRVDLNNNTLASHTAYCVRFLSEWIVRATIGYVDKNGLSDLNGFGAVLLCAMSVCLFRFPALPTADGILLEDDGTLHELLCAKGGVLVDTAVLMKTAVFNKQRPATMYDLKKYAPRTLFPHATTEGNETVAASLTGRYSFSESHVAMVLNLFGILPLDDSWESFERQMAQLCGLVVVCGRYEARIRASLMEDLAANEKNKLNAFDAEVNSQHDPLHLLKKWLNFGELAAGVEIFDLNVAGKDVNEPEMKALLRKYKGLVRSGQVVILISKEKEPFADVIVLGPGRMILLQCKRFRSDDSKINFEEEFEKMCCYKNAADRKALYNYFDALIGVCSTSGQEVVVNVAVVLDTVIGARDEREVKETRLINKYVKKHKDASNAATKSRNKDDGVFKFHALEFFHFPADTKKTLFPIPLAYAPVRPDVPLEKLGVWEPVDDAGRQS